MSQHKTSLEKKTSTEKKTDPIFIEQAKSLCQGGELLPGGHEQLAKKLQHAAQTQTPLRVKLGLDPTRPDLHLGHTVVLKRLRSFQDLGHQAVLIIGDATAMIGDPSGRSATRPALTDEEIKINAETYLEQAGKVLDIRKAEIVRNSVWLSDMVLSDFLKLAAKATVAQLMVREDFAKRYSENKPISLHELFYPLMQGYDSVQVDADIELGGTDQRFNNLMGRELQSAYEKDRQQMVLLMPLLEGTDGVIKMSKSYPDHCINLTDEPNDMLGKLMSISDEMIPRYELLLGLLTPEQIEEQTRQIKDMGMNPRDIKMHLAKYIVAQYHGNEASEKAEQHFVQLFTKKKLPDEMPEITLEAGKDYTVIDVMTENELAPSRNEGRRLIQGGGVKLHQGESLDDMSKIEDDKAVLNFSKGTTVVLQSGKRKFLKLNF